MDSLIKLGMFLLVVAGLIAAIFLLVGLYYGIAWLYLSKEEWRAWRLKCRARKEAEAEERELVDGRKYADVNLNIGYDLSPEQLDAERQREDERREE